MPKPASARTGAPSPRKAYAPVTSRSSRAGCASRSKRSRGGWSRVARPRSASSRSCGSSSRWPNTASLRPVFQTSAAGTNRLASSVAWSRTCRVQTCTFVASAPSSGGTNRKQVRKPESPVEARRYHTIRVPARARTSCESGSMVALAVARASSTASSGAARFARAAVLGKGRGPMLERATESTMSASICARTSPAPRPRRSDAPASARHDGGIARANARSRSASAAPGAGSQRASKPRPSRAWTSRGRRRPRAASSRANRTVAARCSNDASPDVSSERSVPDRRSPMAAPGSNASVGTVQGSMPAGAASPCGGAAAMRGEGHGLAVSPGSQRVSRPGRTSPGRPASPVVAAPMARARPAVGTAHGWAGTLVVRRALRRRRASKAAASSAQMCRRRSSAQVACSASKGQESPCQSGRSGEGGSAGTLGRSPDSASHCRARPRRRSSVYR